MEHVATLLAVMVASTRRPQQLQLLLDAVAAGQAAPPTFHLNVALPLGRGEVGLMMSPGGRATEASSLKEGAR